MSLFQVGVVRVIYIPLQLMGFSTVVTSGLFSIVLSDPNEVDKVKLSADIGKCPRSSQNGRVSLDISFHGFST